MLDSDIYLNFDISYIGVHRGQLAVSLSFASGTGRHASTDLEGVHPPLNLLLGLGQRRGALGAGGSKLVRRCLNEQLARKIKHQRVYQAAVCGASSPLICDPHQFVTSDSCVRACWHNPVKSCLEWRLRGQGPSETDTRRRQLGVALTYSKDRWAQRRATLQHSHIVKNRKSKFSPSVKGCCRQGVVCNKL